MVQDFYYGSCGAGQIHGRTWMPEGYPKAIIQIVHGIAEHIGRYDHFANYLNSLGYMVVAENHMGHGGSVEEGSIRGYFHGGWFCAVADTYHLLQMTKEKYPDVPYILLGHSMGSFMARTILGKYPDSGITGCIISGTGWKPKMLLKAALPLCNFLCKRQGETTPSEPLDRIVFGSYNSRVEHPRTLKDWLSRDPKVVDAYVADPLCGFVPSAGLLRDMMTGITYIQTPQCLDAMEKTLPILFVAGGDDPVGNYGEGVRQTAAAFDAAGMQDVTTKIYPLCRHEVLNEINKQEVYADICNWIEKHIS